MVFSYDFLKKNSLHNFCISSALKKLLVHESMKAIERFFLFIVKRHVKYLSLSIYLTALSFDSSDF